MYQRTMQTIYIVSFQRKVQLGLENDVIRLWLREGGGHLMTLGEGESPNNSQGDITDN